MLHANVCANSMPNTIREPEPGDAMKAVAAND